MINSRNSILFAPKDVIQPPRESAVGWMHQLIFSSRT